MDESSAPEDPSESVSHIEPVGDSAVPTKPPILSYRSAVLSSGSAISPETLVTLRRMDAVEAQLARMKLESEGIRCFVAGQMLSGTHPLVFSDVQLQVAEGDSHLAEEVLNRPVEQTEDGEYIEEEWRCPKCHRRKVDLVPLSRGKRRLRYLLVLVLISPILAALLDPMFSDARTSNTTASTSEVLLLLWLIVAATLIWIVLTDKRRKLCRECGHEWGAAERSE